MANEDAVRLRHMFDAANKAVEFAKGKTRRDLEYAYNAGDSYDVF